MPFNLPLRNAVAHKPAFLKDFLLVNPYYHLDDYVKDSFSSLVSRQNSFMTLSCIILQACLPLST